MTGLDVKRNGTESAMPMGCHCASLFGVEVPEPERREAAKPRVKTADVLR